MYADRETKAMKAALEETDRRREIQLAHNIEHGITAATIVKGISDISDFLTAESKTPKRRRRGAARNTDKLEHHELERMIVDLEQEMLEAAADLRFEYAARLRDELRDLHRALGDAKLNEAPAAAR
jgi:excinuclease ABC subunit B